MTDFALPPSFQAFRIERGDKVSGAVTRVSLDQLSPGEVIVHTRYAGLNYKDALATTDHGQVIRHFPRIGGSDLAGVVVHSDDPRFQPGDEVIAYAQGLGVDQDGGFSEFVRLSAAQTLALPPGISAFEAAALGVAGFTAALAVHLLQDNGLVPTAGTVLVNGATGGVGSIAIDMLHGLGYRVAALSSKADQHDFLRRLGATEIIDAKALRDSGKPLDSARWSGAIDNVGGSQLAWLARTVQPRGVIAAIGNAGGNELVTSVLPFILRAIRLVGVNVSFYRELENMLWQRLATDLKPTHLHDNTECITLDDLPECIRRMLAGQSTGRTVVTWE